MTRTITIIFSFVTINLFAQTTPATIKVKKEAEPKTIVLIDRPAFFKDSTNLDNLFIKNFIDSNLRLPDSVKTGLVSGKVFVGFTIKENGQLTNIRILKGIKGCVACDKEVVRLFSVMPKWTPALILSKPTSSDRNLPILFINQNKTAANSKRAEE